MQLSSVLHPPVEEIIHGSVVRDPYRWLEDRYLPGTEAWIRDQQQQCEDYFADCHDLDVIRDRVRRYLDIEVKDQPARVGNRCFYRRRRKGQEQASIYVCDDRDGEERLLVDPSAFGRYASAGIQRISPDGSLLAYELKEGGGDRKSLHIVEAASGRTLPDSIETGYARGFAFTSDRGGFYYCYEIEQQSEHHTIAFHAFGEMEPDQECFRVTRTRGSRLVLIADAARLGAIHIHRSGGDDVLDFWIAPQNDPECWHCVFRDRTLPFSPILKQGRILALSYEQAPNGKLIELNDAGDEIRTVIPEQAGMLRQLVITDNDVFINLLDAMKFTVSHWNLAGEYQGYLNTPSGGTIQLLASQSDHADSIFYIYESFAQPPTVYEYNSCQGCTRTWHARPSLSLGSPFSVHEETYPSKDDTVIPITIVTRQRSGLAGCCPVIMTGYGGFGAPMTPQFSVLVTIMMELGANFALPHIRGGGEFGKDWHEAARGRKRQVAFDDFIAAAEWLCSEGYTTPGQLGIFGGSNSGLLVGVAMTQRPELFGAVLCIAPLLDMVRYEHFDQSAKWRHEYGTVDDPEDFAALYAYSPYHHVEDNLDYPAILFVSGDSDDRCNPAHARKTAARLQEPVRQMTSVVVDYSEKRGHSPVLPLSIRVDALVRRIVFLCRELSIPVAVGGSDEAIRA
jgi:prolyl oligopeptidase